MTDTEIFEKKIDFTPVRAALTGKCITAEGRDKCMQFGFNSDFNAIKGMLNATAEMLAIVSGEEDIAIGRVRSVSRQLQAIRVPGSYLPAGELVDLRATLEAVAEISDYFAKRRQEGESPYPHLDVVVRELYPHPESLRAINSAIDRYGNVKDNASAELADIRRQLASLQSSLSARMRRVMQHAVQEGYIDADATPSVRDGRLVVPVAPMYKRKINGIVHDESASGKTVYIEPAEIVEANNRLRELELEERREIVRILTSIADLLRPHLDRLLDTMQLLGELDFIHAKALYARDIDARLPSLHPQPGIEWYHAVHPTLLASLRRHGKEPVPLDITLTPERRILVISGPNAGGKSVCIKTVAIVQYMLQCGLLPPVYENSHAGVFKEIMVDIGDDQSMEDDLSTYSSHLANMKRMLQRGTNRTLVIIDEMGSGTEPQIGGALAQAMLQSFNNKGVWGVITSHYQNLKTFADSTAGMVNGCMLYDRQQMKPLYKLSIGSPGSSFAIEIARKIGLPADIIAGAEKIVGSDYINLDRYLLDIARDKRYWENKRTQIRQKEKRIDDVLARYEAQAEELRTQRRDIISDARRRAEEILAGAGATIERTVHDIRRAQAEREATLEARKRLAEERKSLAEENGAAVGDSHPLLKSPGRRRNKNGNNEARKSTETKPTEATERVLTAGDIVKLDGQTTPGQIIEVSGKKATVVFGNLKTTVNISRLKPTNAQLPKPQHTVTVNTTHSGVTQFSPEIDVRGMRADEAVQAVTYYIDDALRYNAHRVRILHGTGTGALRQYIRQYLGTVDGVTHFADEDVRFGGAGITVVDLD